MKPERAGEQLTTWKEIAQHLGVTARTAQRWEQGLGLPVERDGGAPGRVRADAAALDRWRMTVLRGRDWWRRHWGLLAAATAAVAVLAVCGVLWLGNRPGGPASYRIDGNTLVVSDAAGRQVWRKTFERPLNERSIALLEDVNGDGAREALFGYEAAGQSALVCFSERGEEEWRFRPGREANGASYVVARIAVALPRIIVLAHHAESWPTQLVALDGRGRVVGEYWHSGRLSQMEIGELDGDDVPEILLCGLDQVYQAATLVVLDPRRLGGGEKARVLFRRTCINRALEAHNEAIETRFYGNRVGVRVREKLGNEFFAIRYRLNRDLSVHRVDWPEPLKELHRKLERGGVLDHRLTQEEMDGMRELRVLKAMGPGP